MAGRRRIAAVAVLLLVAAASLSAVDGRQPPKSDPAVANYHHNHPRTIKPLPVGLTGTQCGPNFKGAVTVKRDKTSRIATYTFHGPCLKALPKDAVAWASYDDLMTTSGWGELTLKTNQAHPDIEQAFAAGYLEGSLTHERITQISRFIKRMHGHDKVIEFLGKQDEFLRKKVTTVDPNDPSQAYWYNIALVIAQMDGMLAGYNDHTPNKDDRLTRLQMWLMNSDGDVLDIERAYAPGRTMKRVPQMSRAELIEMVEIMGHCSMLIKWTGNDLLVGHTTWDDYAEMYRIYKHYHFGFNHPSIKAKKSSHSSYPGFVTSSDDFYILDTGLVVTETTLNILNEQLYNLCNPKETVIAWVRNLVSNRLSTTGKEWCDNFSKYNSGTYNDQWAVIDYKQFKPGQKQLAPNTLWILEQIPGYIEKQDMTATLNKDSYWASFNRPYFANINKKSMYAHYESVHGEAFSYRNCSRAKIFQRDHSSVRDLASMKKLMMKNDWQNDPFSEGCPGNAIAARFDIPAPKCNMARVANGATDSKVTNSALASALKSHAISGPTHDQQPPFTWDNPMYRTELHDGQPTVWNFDWKEMVAKNI